MIQHYKSAIILLILIFFTLPVNSQTISFNDTGDTLLLTNPAHYELGILKSNGAITHIREIPSNEEIINGSLDETLWAIGFENETELTSSELALAPDYLWDESLNQLILTYTSEAAILITVTVMVSNDQCIDLQLTLDNHSDSIISTVSFPYTLKFDETKIENGLFPDKPGLLLSSSFFKNLSANPEGISSVHPPAMADYLGLQTENTTLALYSEWGTGPMPVNTFGFEHIQGTTGGMNHTFSVWRPKGYSWTSPSVRIRFADSFEETVRDYRTDNNIDQFQSLKDKLGEKYLSIVQSPYISFDGDWFGSYTGWPEIFKTFTAPAIIYISNYYEGGFHGYFPDVIPPNPIHGTQEEFKAALDSAHAYGLYTMPMILPNWWHENSPTIQNLGNFGLTIDSIAQIDENGNPSYSSWELAGRIDNGYNVSPRVPFVQNRLDQLMNTLSNDIEFDLIYEDVIGAGNMGPDYNTYAPDTIDTEGWLDHTRKYKDHLLVTETGSDIFAETETGFLGGGHPPTWDEFSPDVRAWPMSAFLLKDKVLRYHYWGSGTYNKPALSWNMAFGYMLNIAYDPSHDEEAPGSKWYTVIHKFHTKIISKYADQLLNNYSEFQNGNALKCEYDSMIIVANRDSLQDFAYENNVISPHGVLAYSPDENLVAGVFSSFNNKELNGNDQFLIVQKYADSIEVIHPMGESTPLTLNLLPVWQKSDTLWAKAYDAKGQYIDALEVNNNSTTCTFNCLTRFQGRTVDHYQIVKTAHAPNTDWKIYCNDQKYGDFILGNKHFYEIHIAHYTTALDFIIDKTSGDTISFGSEWGRLWGVEFPDAPFDSFFLDPISSFAPGHSFRIESEWSAIDSTLTFHYESDSTAGMDVTVTFTISSQNYFDMQISLLNDWGYTAKGVSFPHHLILRTDSTTSAILPLGYPGARLKPSFFLNEKQYEAGYPGAFKSDFMAFQKQQGNLSIYSLWENNRVINTQMGFIYNPAGFYLYDHRYAEWIENGESWTSPKLRFRIGDSPIEAIKEFRKDNNLDDPTTSLSNKLDSVQFKQLASSPLIFNTFGETTYSGFTEFSDWAMQIPSPAIMMLTGFNPEGKFGLHPDILPPDESWGNASEFKSMIDKLHYQGKLVMPYTIPGWWNENSPTVLNLSGSNSINNISVINDDSNPAYTTFNGQDFGYWMDVSNEFVKNRIAKNISDLKGTYQCDFIFEDFIGNAPVNSDYNSSYNPDWMNHTSNYSDSLLMFNSAYDRLVPNATGNISTTYFNKNYDVSPFDYDFGDENWEFYPFTPIAFNDKLITYQSAEKSTTNKDILSWNMLYGCGLGFTPEINNSQLNSDTSYINIINLFQSKALSSLIGKQMSDYVKLSEYITKSEFENIEVVRNESKLSGYDYNRCTISPQGALLKTSDGNLIAGILDAYNNVSLNGSDHYLIVKKTKKEYTIYHPKGAETSITIDRPVEWSDSNRIKVQPVTDSMDIFLQRELTDNSIKFNLISSISGEKVICFKLYYSDYYEGTTEFICKGDSLLWNGSYFSEAGVYYDSLKTEIGNDSVLWLNLAYYETNPLFIGNDTILYSNEKLTLDPGDAFTNYNWSDGSHQQTYVFDASVANTETSMIWLFTTDSNKCIQSDTITITVQKEDFVLSPEFIHIKIYPNPASKKLLINAQELKKNVALQFYNLDGSMVKEYQIEPKTYFELDISDLKREAYLLKMRSNDRSYIYKLLVK